MANQINNFAKLFNILYSRLGIVNPKRLFSPKGEFIKGVLKFLLEGIEMITLKEVNKQTLQNHRSHN
ncbi:hypothetical protein V7087_07405 [Neobacillus niacini]|uniref:hypothetical protein n=1 Tax=Neobacillus niacini TaxID=86668 RepID=UPI003000B789